MLVVFAGILAVSLIASGAGLRASHEVLTEGHQGRELRSLNQDLRATALTMQVAHHRFAATGLGRDRAAYVEARESLAAALRRALEEAQDAGYGAVAGPLRRQRAHFAEWVEAHGDPAVEARAEEPAEALRLAHAEEGRQRLADLLRANRAVDLALAPSIAAVDERLESTVRWATAVLAVVLAVGVVAVLVTYVRLRRDVFVPLRGVLDTLRRLKAGETDVWVEPQGAQEAQEVARALNTLNAQNQHLLREQASRLERERQVAAATRKIRSSLDRSSVLAAAAEAIGMAVGVDQVTIRAIGYGWEDLGGETWAAPDRPRLQSNPPLDVLTREMNRKLVAGQTVEVNVDDPTQVSDVGREWMHRHGHTRALIAPVVAGGRLLAAVGMSWLDPDREVTAEDRSTVEAVCRELGTALGHARLYESQRALVVQLQQLDQAKSDLVSSVSHELRTPLASIAGYVELLDDRDLGDLTAEQSKALDVIERNTARLRHLVEDLQTLAMLEEQKIELDMVPVDLGDVVRRSLGALRSRLEERSQELVTEVDERLPAVAGDVLQLERAVTNLVSNAIKFTPERGRVTVTLHEADDGYVELRVSDTGIGIPSEEQDKLFTRFFRSSKAVEQAIPGTGLGLVIVKEIVEAHGGSIAFTSEEGRGTTFTVRVPPSTRRASPSPTPNPTEEER